MALDVAILRPGGVDTQGVGLNGAISQWVFFSVAMSVCVKGAILPLSS